MYELPRKLPNNSRLKILGNQERSGKSQSLIELLPRAQSPPKPIFFLYQQKNSEK